MLRLAPELPPSAKLLCASFVFLLFGSAPGLSRTRGARPGEPSCGVAGAMAPTVPPIAWLLLLHRDFRLRLQWYCIEKFSATPRSISPWDGARRPSCSRQRRTKRCSDSAGSYGCIRPRYRRTLAKLASKPALTPSSLVRLAVAGHQMALLKDGCAGERSQWARQALAGHAGNNDPADDCLRTPRLECRRPKRQRSKGA